MKIVKTKIIYKRILFLCLSIIFILLFGEILLRIIYPKQFPFSWRIGGKYKLDQDLIFSLEPNYKGIYKTDDFIENAITNSFGFRDTEVKQKNHNTIRIIAVGDSFTYGHGISENELTFPSQLAGKLKNTIQGKSVEVINTGVSAYSPDQEYRFIQAKILGLEPDIIIWALNPNDVYNLLDTTGYFPSLYDLDTTGNLLATSAKTTSLYLKGLISDKLPDVLRRSRTLMLIASIIDKFPELNRIRLIPQKERFTWAQRKLTKEVLSASDFAKFHKIKLIIVLIPTKDVYTDARKAKFVQQFLYQPIIDIRKVGVSYYDLGEEMTDIYRKESQNENGILSNFYKIDYHINEKGAQLVANLIAEHIKDEISH